MVKIVLYIWYRRQVDLSAVDSCVSFKSSTCMAALRTSQKCADEGFGPVGLSCMHSKSNVGDSRLLIKFVSATNSSFEIIIQPSAIRVWQHSQSKRGYRDIT